MTRRRVVLMVAGVLVVALVARAYGRGGADQALSAVVNVCVGGLILIAVVAWGGVDDGTRDEDSGHEAGTENQ